MKGASYEAPHYAAFSTLPPLPFMYQMDHPYQHVSDCFTSFMIYIT